MPLPSVPASPPQAAIALPSEAPVPAPGVPASPPQAAIASASGAPAPEQPPTAPPPPAPSQPPQTLRVGFAPGQSNLPPSEAGALTELGQAMPRTGTARVEVLAYAPVTEGDASAARRLSLARALAVRSTLAGAGVPADRIIMRALGSPPAEQAGAANDAIVTVMGTSGTAAPKQGKQP